MSVSLACSSIGVKQPYLFALELSRLCLAVRLMKHSDLHLMMCVCRRGRSSCFSREGPGSVFEVFFYPVSMEGPESVFKEASCVHFKRHHSRLALGIYSVMSSGGSFVLMSLVWVYSDLGSG